MSAVIQRRQWLVGLGASCATVLGGSPAFAGAAIPISLPELVHLSRFAVVATAREANSAWERDSAGKRIVTTTRLEVQQPLDERAPPDSQLFVRTLGGRVGDIGQIVHGEAELEKNKPAVFFLHEPMDGVFGITAMAQGHYPLAADSQGTFRLSVSPRLGDFFQRSALSAVSRLRGRTVADCERLVLEALDRGR